MAGAPLDPLPRLTKLIIVSNSQFELFGFLGREEWPRSEAVWWSAVGGGRREPARPDGDDRSGEDQAGRMEPRIRVRFHSGSLLLR